jgi:hypothetical protein
MGIHVTSVQASTVADVGTQQGFETLADAALATLLSNNIRNIVFQAKNMAGALGVELSLTVAYDDDGVTITSPYQVKVFKGASADAAADAAQAWITLAQGIALNYWIGPVLAQYAPGMRQFTEPYYVMVVYNTSATDGPLNFQGVERPEEFKALKNTTPAVTPFFAGGFIEAPAADANLDQASPSQTYGTANQPYGAHAFVVCGAAGTTDAGVVGLRVTGDSITDDGTVTAADAETIIADITAVGTDEYYQTNKRWVGTVTFELFAVSGVPTTYALDVNYGLVKYETLADRPFILKTLDIYGQAGAAEAAPDIILKRHDSTGWTYSAAAFSPDGGTVLAQLTVDQVGVALGNGLNYAYKRTSLDTEINPDDQEGVLIWLVSPNDANALAVISINIGVQVF